MTTSCSTEPADSNASSAARERDASFELLFAQNPLPMWVYDLATLQFLQVNDAAIRHYGYSRDEFLAMRIVDIRPTEDVPRLLENVGEVRIDEARETVRQDRGTWRHRLKDGSVRHVEIA
ncbi:MAG TPA: PAS domain S-box protein, partial [Casimicrobiaceae bacterium]|nr:PAS domain S-box protein [Casimicrobiaceae bacterium]